MKLGVDKQGKLKVSEADIEKACTEILELDGWRALKTNPCSDRSRGKGFGEIGMADYLYIRYHNWGPQGNAEVMWIEWKRPGGKATLEQRLWTVAERKRGALALIAGHDFPASIEGFKAWYDRWFKRKSVI
jgi:hypothetical protein